MGTKKTLRSAVEWTLKRDGVDDDEKYQAGQRRGSSRITLNIENVYDLGSETTFTYITVCGDRPYKDKAKSAMVAYCTVRVVG